MLSTSHITTVLIRDAQKNGIDRALDKMSSFLESRQASQHMFDIRRELNRRKTQSEEKKRTILTAATTPDERLEEQITQITNSNSKNNSSVEINVNQDLLAGICVSRDGVQIRADVKSQLESLERSLS